MAHHALIRILCIAFWLSVPSLQVAPTFACSVASLRVPRVINCQGITTYTMKTLQTTCLKGVSHQHAMQDLNKKWQLTACLTGVSHQHAMQDMLQDSLLLQPTSMMINGE